MEAEVFQRLDPKSFYRKFLAQSIRPDGRGLHEYRSLSVSSGVLSSKHVAASALVTVGSTKVLAGVTLQVGQPAQVTPNSGDMEVKVHLTPLCSAKFAHAGHVSAEALVVESAIRDAIFGSGAVQREDLCIEQGKHAWKLCVDVTCLNHEGNLMDAALMSVVSCMQQLVLPETVEGEDGKLMIKKEGGDGVQGGKPLVLQHVPVPLTCGIFDRSVIVDPTLLEEDLLSATVTLALADKGQVCFALKPGGGCLSGAQLAECVQRAKAHVGVGLQALQLATASSTSPSSSAAPSLR